MSEPLPARIGTRCRVALARCRVALARRFGVDARALAAFRVSLGLLLLADLLLRSRHLVAFYTDAGVLPRAVLRTTYPGLARLSIHTVAGAAWVQSSLFLVAGGFAVALTVGYRTRLAAVASWILLVSLHARNPVVLSAGDSLLRRLLFWGLFLPLGARWSVDALGRESARRWATSAASSGTRRQVTSVASAALLVQVVLVYVVNAAFKFRGDAWPSGEAAAYVFSIDHLTLSLGDVLARHPDLLAVFDRLWLGMLVASILLVALTGRARNLLAALFVAAHLGMALTVRIGVFPFVSLAALVPFFRGSDWDDDSGGDAPATDESAPADESDPFPDESLPPLAVRWKRRASPAVVTVLLALVLVWNAATLGYVAVPDAAASVADPDEHRWDMFAPEPRRAEVTYAASGRLASGGTVDALYNATGIDPPRDEVGYPSVRWRSYLLDLRRAGYADLREPLAEYLCDRWNRRHAEALVSVRVRYVAEIARLDAPDETRRVEFDRHSCSSG